MIMYVDQFLFRKFFFQIFVSFYVFHRLSFARSMNKKKKSKFHDRWFWFERFDYFQNWIRFRTMNQCFFLKKFFYLKSFICFQTICFRTINQRLFFWQFFLNENRVWFRTMNKIFSKINHHIFQIKFRIHCLNRIFIKRFNIFDQIIVKSFHRTNMMIFFEKIFHNSFHRTIMMIFFKKIRYQKIRTFMICEFVERKFLFNFFCFFRTFDLFEITIFRFFLFDFRLKLFFHFEWKYEFFVFVREFFKRNFIVFQNFDDFFCTMI